MLVAVVVAVVWLLRVPSRVVSVLEPTELPFAFSNPANIPWRRFYIRTIEPKKYPKKFEQGKKIKIVREFEFPDVKYYVRNRG